MSNFVYRIERPDDYAAAEALIREAFWNVYKPGCDEHYIVHCLRGSARVVPALNRVCVDGDGLLLGHIFYTRSRLVDDDGASREVLTFGPISVRPGWQRQGIGSALIRSTLADARDMGFAGVAITGNPAYYHRFGFRPAADYGIVAEDGASFPALMALELAEGRLSGAGGRLCFCPEFDTVAPDALARFDSQFPPREKLRLPGQLV